MDTTCDGILNKRIWIEQPKKGYRVAMDTLLLASAVPALAGQRVLELGCGVGGALLALAARVSGISGLGVDIQGELVVLCQSNIRKNGFDGRLSAESGDICSLPSGMRGAFDHVFMNPPYHDGDTHPASPYQVKDIANIDRDSMAEWIKAAFFALKPTGTLTLIHRADKRSEIERLLERHAKGWVVKPVLPRKGDEAKRLVLRASTQEPSSRDALPLILHEEEGGYTAEADGLLRDMKEMDFTMYSPSPTVF